MKLTLSLLAAVTVPLVLATRVQAQQQVDIKSYALMSTQSKSIGRLCMGQSRADAIKVLGAPSKIERAYFEIDSDTAVVFHYRRNALYFVKDKLASFELGDNSLAYGQSLEQAFRVGAKLTPPAPPVAPDAPVPPSGYLLNKALLKGFDIDSEPGESADYKYHTMVSSHIKFGNENSNGVFELLFDENNKLFHISLRDI